MSTQTVDYDALAKQYGAVSSQPGPQGGGIDYDALAKQHGAISSSAGQTTGVFPPGEMRATTNIPDNPYRKFAGPLVERAASRMGEDIRGIAPMVEHPIDTLKGILAANAKPGGLAQATAEGILQSFKEDPANTVGDLGFAALQWLIGGGASKLPNPAAGAASEGVAPQVITSVAKSASTAPASTSSAIADLVGIASPRAGNILRTGGRGLDAIKSLLADKEQTVARPAGTAEFTGQVPGTAQAPVAAPVRPAAIAQPVVSAPAPVAAPASIPSEAAPVPTTARAAQTEAPATEQELKILNGIRTRAAAAGDGQEIDLATLRQQQQSLQDTAARQALSPNAASLSGEGALRKILTGQDNANLLKIARSRGINVSKEALLKPGTADPQIIQKIMDDFSDDELENVRSTYLQNMSKHNFGDIGAEAWKTLSLKTYFPDLKIPQAVLNRTQLAIQRAKAGVAPQVAGEDLTPQWTEALNRVRAAKAQATQ